MLLALLALTLVGCRADEIRGTPRLRRIGSPGSYWEYVPATCDSRSPVLVIAHGMLNRGQDAVSVARNFILRWVPLAQRRKLALVAPAFNQQSYGGRAGPGGGYRGLFGRDIGADEFVERAVAATAARWGLRAERFLLYGHSAGGQFASRYLVQHPDRLMAVVLSAPGKFPFPDPSAPWPNGLGRLRRSLEWPGRRARQVDISPDPATWAQAATLRVSVVVGSRDTRRQGPRPGQQGSTRLARARHWVAAVNQLAARKGKVGRVRLVVVPGVGHSSRGLTARCAAELARSIH